MGKEGSKIYSKIARGTCPLSAVLLDVNFSCTVEYGPTARLAAVEYYGTAIVRLSFGIFIGGGGARTIAIIVHYGCSNYYVQHAICIHWKKIRQYL